MPKPCSLELRERVVDAVESGASRREAADWFEVSPSSAIKWMQRRQATGSIAPKPSGGSISPLEAHAAFLFTLIARQPDLTLDEIVAVSDGATRAAIRVPPPSELKLMVCASAMEKLCSNITGTSTKLRRRLAIWEAYGKLESPNVAQGGARATEVVVPPPPGVECVDVLWQAQFHYAATLIHRDFSRFIRLSSAALHSLIARSTARQERNGPNFCLSP
jgi:hypothetical protein